MTAPTAPAVAPFTVTITSGDLPAGTTTRDDGIRAVLTITADDRHRFDQLPRGLTPHRVVVTDLATGAAWVVGRSDCPCGCGAVGRAVAP